MTHQIYTVQLGMRGFGYVIKTGQYEVAKAGPFCSRPIAADAARKALVAIREAAAAMAVAA